MRYFPENISPIRALGVAASAAGALLLSGCTPNHSLTPDRIAALSPAARVDYDFAGGNPAAGSGNEEGTRNYYNADCLNGGQFDPYSLSGRQKATVTIVNGVITVKRSAQSDDLPKELHFTDEGPSETLKPSDKQTADFLDAKDCKTGPYDTK